MFFIDARKAYLNLLCEENMYLALPDEAGVAEGICGKFKRWMYGMRPAAQA